MNYKISHNNVLSYVDKNIDSFIIPDIVETIDDYVFSKCYLKSINLKKIKKINYSAFWGSKRLEYVDIPDSVMKIHEHAFTDCDKLKNININHDLLIYDYVFSRCSNLYRVNIPNVSKIGFGVFYKCDKLCIINSKLTEEQLIIAFGSKSQYKSYKQRNREYKLDQLFNE